jgi:hypothetical protein
VVWQLSKIIGAVYRFVPVLLSLLGLLLLLSKLLDRIYLMIEEIL